MAIDIEGNPIIVKQPEEFRITSDPSNGQPLLVYVVVNYVDPSQLRRANTGNGSNTMQETFRIVEKLQPDPQDVELCRIWILPDTTALETPPDSFRPGPNQLDFRWRRYPRPYPQLRVQVGQVRGTDRGDGSSREADEIAAKGLTDLLRSLDTLYPQMAGVSSIHPYVDRSLNRDTPFPCQLLYIRLPVLLGLSNPALQRLQTHLQQGGTLLVVTNFSQSTLLDLLNIRRELEKGLGEADIDPNLMGQIQAELREMAVAIQEQLSTLEQSLAAIAPKLGITLTTSGDLDDDHPLRTQPFMFSQLPTRLGHPVYVKAWGGLVYMIGDLTYSWGRGTTANLPREVLRSAQEWGINLLHFAAQRQEWYQQMQAIATQPTSPTDSLKTRVREG